MYKLVLVFFTSFALAIKLDGDDRTKLEHCPDFDQNFTLVDGRTKAVACPKKGCNCTSD